MPNGDSLEAAVDKFVFRVKSDCRYSNSDVWAKRVEGRVRAGLTDFLQQKSGDVAFVDVKPLGTLLAADDDCAALETIKVDLVVPAPISGTVVAANPALTEHPELVNIDPYGGGWIVEIEPSNWAEFDALLDAESYLPQMRARAALEREK